MKHPFIVVAIAAVVVAASASSVNTHAASDYLLEIDGIKGESSSAQAANRAPARPAPKAAPARVRVAVGDLNGDGSAAKPPSQLVTPGHKPHTALLLPAIQKVRDVAK